MTSSVQFTGLPTLSTPASGDILATVDVSDTTSGLSGTSKQATAGAVLGAVGIPVFNVTDATYGAIGNGVIDDTLAIQAALTAAAVAGGGIVFLPRGTYKISTGINPGSYTQIVGAGMGVTTIKLSTDLLGTYLQQGMICQQNAATDIRIADLTLDGNKTVCTNVTFNRGIFLQNTTRPITERVRVINTMAEGIRYDDSTTDGLISACDVSATGGGPVDNGNGIMLRSITVDGTNSTNVPATCKRHRIVNNNLGNVATTGIILFNVEDVLVEGNIVNLTTYARGINIGPTPHKVSIVGNRIIGAHSTGIHFCYSAKQLLIANNVVSDTIADGSGVGNEGQGIKGYVGVNDNVTIVGNISTGNFTDGIAIMSGFNYAVISGNNCGLNGRDGIRISAGTGYANQLPAGSVFHTTVTGNQCNGNAGSGINMGNIGGTDVTQVVDHFTVTGNACTSNTRYGIEGNGYARYGTVSKNSLLSNTLGSLSLIGANVVREGNNTIELGNAPLLFDVTQYNAKGDGITDDTVAIQAAIDACSAAGGGIVVVPPTSSYYNITSALLPRDNVTLQGAGYGSFIKNTRTTGINTAIGNIAVIKIGGYESVYPAAGGVYTVYAETFYACADGVAGSPSITLSTPANAANFAPGDIAFLRTAAQDPTNIQKPIPKSIEMNEVLSSNAGTGVVTFKHPLHSDFAGLTVAKSSGTLLAPNGESIRVIKRFRMDNLRMETSALDNPASSGLCYGGGWECEFSNLWMTQVEGAIMLQVMARCVFRNITVNYTGRFGEEAYFCHDNVYENGYATYQALSGYTPGNGWAVNEGARDSRYNNWNINHGSATALPLSMGDVLNITYTKSRIEQGSTAVACLVGIYATGRDYKPQGVTFSDNDVVFINSTAGNRPRAHVIVDTGGPNGGGCAVARNRFHGQVYVAPVLLARQDVRLAAGSQYGCSNNVVEDNVAIQDSTGIIPYNAVVAEYNNNIPVAGSETMIDTTWTPSSNTIRNNLTRLTQVPITESNIGAISDGAGAGTVARRHIVPRGATGVRTRYVVQVSGTVAAGMVTDPKTIALTFGGTSIASVAFLAAETGTFRFEVEIGGPSLNANRTTVTSASTMPVAQTATVRVWKGATLTTTTASAAITTDTAATNLDLTVTIGNTHADTVTIDGWSVTPLGTEFTDVKWTQLLALFGGYPVISY